MSERYTMDQKDGHDALFLDNGKAMPAAQVLALLQELEAIWRENKRLCDLVRRAGYKLQPWPREEKKEGA